ncbi:MAG: hypothetical protein LBC44_02370 [Mycoplasmataceae bacterium]|jgi:hypothetical protein|nr:hypothetical protein [Mycoplasmataceae bacterium]
MSKYSGKQQHFDFDWIMEYLGIKDQEKIEEYKRLNIQQMHDVFDKFEEDEDGKEIRTVLPVPEEVQHLYIDAGVRFRGRHIAHFCPSRNIIEFKS